jgi:hypothetical protein
MKMPDIRRYEMLVRVRAFGVEHADLFPAATVAGRLFVAVAAAVDQVTRCGVTQTHGATASDRPSTKTTTRNTLRALLLKVARTARAIAPETPGLDGKFVMPRSRSEQRLVLAARAFVVDATPLRDQFVAHHLPAPFLDDLAIAIDAFEQAIQARVGLRQSRAAARVGIAEALNAGASAVRRLDAVVANVLDGREETLAKWRSARHVSHVSVPGGSRKQTAAPTPALAVVPKAA